MNEISVSPETEALIHCLIALDKHREQTLKALQITYSEKISMQLMDSTYTPAFENLRKAVQQFILISIDSNLEFP